MSPKSLLRWLPLVLILAVLAAAMALGLHKQLSFDTLKANREVLVGLVNANPLLAAAAFVLVYMVFTMAMIPGALWITIAGGFLFGLIGGALLTVTGATAGATLLFLAARTGMGEGLRARAGPFLARLQAGFAENPISYMLTLRFLPVVPFPVANIAPALLGAKLLPYSVTTAIGIVPGVLAYALVGSQLGVAFDANTAPDLIGFGRQLLPAFLALAAVSLLPIVIKRLQGPAKGTV